MSSEITMRINHQARLKAEHYAASQGYELEQLLESYIMFLADKDEKKKEARQELHTFMKDLHHEFDHEIDGDAKKDYRRYLIEKYK